MNTNMKVKIDFTLTRLSAKKTVKRNCHMNDSAKGRYDMILGRYLLTDLGLNLNFFDQLIEEYYGYFKGSTAPMVDMGNDEIKDLNTGNITPEGLFTNDYKEETHKSEQLRTSAKWWHVISNAKYEKAYLNKATKNQQKNLT